MRRPIAFLMATFFVIAAMLTGVISTPANAMTLTVVGTEGGYDPNYEPESPPKIIGKMIVGSTLKATKGVWNPPDLNTWGFEWYKVMPNGSLRLKKFGSTYTIKPKDKGFAIVVMVTVSHDDYAGTAYSRPRLVK